MITRLAEENRGFYEEIAKDCKTSLIQFIGEAGIGKTSSLRTIIDYIKTRHPEIQFVIFDCSMAWFHNAPVKYRQLVTRERIQQGKITNEYDCVYEMGMLSEEEKRFFVGTVLQQHFNQRYEAKIKDGTLNNFPHVCFIYEESNIYFGSYSFRRNDQFSQIFQMFVSVGRNYKMRGFLIATAEQGEISPSLRRRTRKIYGATISQGDIMTAKKIGITIDISTLPKYTFHYYGHTVKVPDLVSHEPEDFQRNQPVSQKQGNSGLEWLAGFLAPIVIFLLLLAYFA